MITGTPEDLASSHVSSGSPLGIGVLNALLIILPYLLALLAIGGLVGSQLSPTTLGEPFQR
jgi:hypothetical protein